MPNNWYLIDMCDKLSKTGCAHYRTVLVQYIVCKMYWHTRVGTLDSKTSESIDSLKINVATWNHLTSHFKGSEILQGSSCFIGCCYLFYQ